MHVEDIKAELRKRFGSLVRLSRSLGKNPNMVTCVLSTPGHSVPVEREIAKLLNREPHEVWPDRYHPDGTPISNRVDRTPSQALPVLHRANGVAA
ncbi:helix-turn-helix domain-containing protein [Gluconacetobacter azotocaptans]|uniref:helix-turn-helix domain-containing protein n=1 Tax=Gluconacetobacter azotocaptans TaxID=142834 RepID=UPI001F033C48|nr:helix-turn-helix domain-containing protein [Gluconacetobacter azotocaptans]